MPVQGLDDVEVVDGESVAASLIPRAVTAGELLFDDWSTQTFAANGDTSYFEALGRPTQGKWYVVEVDASGRSGRRPIELVTTCSGSPGDETVGLSFTGPGLCWTRPVDTPRWLTGSPVRLGQRKTSSADDIASRARSCGSCSSRRARHRALGKLDPGPDVHVDDDADDLEHLLRAEVLASASWKRWNAASRSVSATRVSASV